MSDYDTPPDYVGSVAVPLAAPATGTPTGDPALGYFLAFVQSFVNANATQAWGAVGLQPSALYPAPTGLMTKAGYDGSAIFKTFAHNPEEGEFNSALLPALFAWRTSEDPERVGDHWFTQEIKAAVRWVLPANSDQALNSRINPFISAMAKMFRIAMERGQDPSWVVANDPDPKAATQGSVLVRWMSASGRWPWLSPWTRTKIFIGEGMFDAYATTLNFTERYVLNTGRQYNRITTPPAAPDQVTLKTPDGGYGDGGLVLGVQDLKGPS